jgi:hypothetical protein
MTMGIFKSRAQKKWEAEYQRRLSDPTVKKDVMTSWRLGGSEVRVADANGEMRRPNGEQCCGCGQAPRNIKPYKSHHHDDNHHSNDHHHAEENANQDNPDDDAPRGYFCSWI